MFIETILLSLINYPPFNNAISNNISQYKAIAYYDTSVDAGVMGSYQIITNNEEKNEIKHRIFFKEYRRNSLRSTEATELLDIVEIAYRKSKYIKNGSIVFYSYNGKLIGTINCEELTEN